MSGITKPAPSGGLAAWITAVNIDLSASIAVSRAAAKAIAELSPDAADSLKSRLAEEASALEAQGGLESSTAAAMVRRALEPAS